MEGDLSVYKSKTGKKAFQSTPSAWRVTGRYRGVSSRRGISIHTLRMEGDYYKNASRDVSIISIHTLRMEGDDGNSLTVTGRCHFNPHPPHGG